MGGAPSLLVPPPPPPPLLVSGEKWLTMRELVSVG